MSHFRVKRETLSSEYPTDSAKAAVPKDQNAKQQQRDWYFMII
ncbi:hypothetical protein GARC_0476 [Paraglaciecola arctica BSs20135]|uniref:Uncharacterized protein n=1 Tax=Paraglaciecola arctica BSs20135 TaxID=493475 RepID=K6YLF1_9ALTE|nr:hypothetical protein GARC_0476 [Paraglaciecola arctica BSs20135]